MGYRNCLLFDPIMGVNKTSIEYQCYNLVDAMELICPSLNREEEASTHSIAGIVPKIANKENPFVIPEKDEMTYMQGLWAPKGYDLEYQEGNVFEHYWLKELTTQDDVIWALQSYLKKEHYWKTKFNFDKKDIATPSHKIGFKLVAFFGRLFKNL